MSAMIQGSSRAARLRLKYFVFGCLALMMLYVLQHNERFLVDGSNPTWQHIQPFRWWLLPHGLAGGIALLLAPWQFSDWLRQHHAKVHRVIGWTYIAGVFVLAPLGAYIQYLEETLFGAPRSFTLAATVDALLLLSTTSIALYFILQRKIQQHRQWMTRSYAVALVFFEVRLVAGVFGFDDSGTAAETIVWICVALAIPLADVVLQVQESLQKRSAAVKVAPTTSG